MTAPKGLKAAGKALWRSVADGLPDGFELTDTEAVLLSMAAHQADDLDSLEDVVAKEGAMSTGSQGQAIVHPALAEARQARVAIARLIGAIAYPAEDSHPVNATSQRAQRAANARWNRRDRVAGQRRAAAERAA